MSAMPTRRHLAQRRATLLRHGRCRLRARRRGNSPRAIFGHGRRRVPPTTSPERLPAPDPQAILWEGGA